MATMDFCGHLMRECYETKNFTLPQPVSKITQVKGAPVKFTKDDDEANLRRFQKKNFYDQKTCRHLCSNTIILESTTTIAVSPCESMCFGLTKTSQSGEQICPTQNLCPTGCPCQDLKIHLLVRLKKEWIFKFGFCPFYECEKLNTRQKLAPFFDLKKKSQDTSVTSEGFTDSNGDYNKIFGRWSENKKYKFPIIFSDMTESPTQKMMTNFSDLLFPYERFH